jgi:hypothetical protein
VSERRCLRPAASSVGNLGDECWALPLPLGRRFDPEGLSASNQHLMNGGLKSAYTSLPVCTGLALQIAGSDCSTWNTLVAYLPEDFCRTAGWYGSVDVRQSAESDAKATENSGGVFHVERRRAERSLQNSTTPRSQPKALPDQTLVGPHQRTSAPAHQRTSARAHWRTAH